MKGILFGSAGIDDVGVVVVKGRRRGGIVRFCRQLVQTLLVFMVELVVV